MKKRLVSLILIVLCTIVFGAMGLTACTGGQTPSGPQKLSAPVVTLTNNVATWQADTNADKFEISLDGNLSYVENIVTSKTLTNGQTLKVRAVGNGITYSTSDWSNSVTYTSSTPEPQPVKLGAPSVTISDTGLASWQAVANAGSYVYKIDGGEETPTTATSVQLVDGQSIVVKAVGDGTNYTDSDYSAAQTFTASTPEPQPTKLGAPTVTISDTGLASWQAVANASSYVYKIDGGAETPTAATSVQLISGQSIVVKAVGDGTNYTDSDYSATQTFTASTQAPTYLGIVASDEAPTSNDVPEQWALLPSGAYNTSMSLEDRLKEFLSNSDNALGETAPTASNYELFSASEQTVYIQIWLNNPDQNTILSLKLNGTKYQSGGALQSFFVADGSSYLNCVYVAVAIPANSYREISYEVTEIEYVEGANISQSGKAVLIDENNDTVTIGLPYEERLPSVAISNTTATATSISMDISVTDEDNFVNLVGGWLRVIIYNQDSEILAQQKLTSGNNTVTFNNLSADTYYNIMAFVYGDTHDGNGVSVIALSSQTHKTETVITASITSDILQNEQTGKYYPVINVTAELGDTSFTFTKVEVCDWGGEVYYTGDFDGSINITENIFNNKSYVIKVYYENASGLEQSYSDSVFVERLDYPWVLEPCLQYGLIDDAILGFDFGDNKSNFDNLTIKIIDEYSKQYLAADAIYLIDNPNAIADLEAQWRSMGRDNPDFNAVYDRWYKLDQAQTKINEYYASVQKAEWQAELAKGIYSYVLVYGEDDEFFKGVGNKYYVVLDGYQSQRVNDYSWKYTLSADFDLNDGEGVEEDRTIIDGWFDIKAALTKNDYLFAEKFTLDDENVVYLETKSRNNLGNESYRKLGYVNQIVLAKGYDILQVLWSQEDDRQSIDEAAWMGNAISALKAGEDVNSVFPLGEMKPITVDLDDIQFDSSFIGYYSIRFTYIMYGKEYTTEHPYDWDGQVIDYTIEGPLPQVTIEFTNNAEDFGRWSITSPDWVKNGIWNFSYSIEVRDASQNLVDESNYGQYEERLPLNYSIRVRLDSYVGGDYYKQGPWSDWFTCLPIKLNAPNTFTQSFDFDGVKVEWTGVEGAEKFVYVINGGEEQELYGNSITGLKNGDTLKLKAVPAANSNYAESDYSEVYTVNDTRTQLATPTNIRVQDKMLMWNEVENVTYYEIEYIRNGQPFVEQSYSPDFFYLIIGSTYRIRACNEDVQNYKASDWSESFTYTVTLENPTFSEVRSQRVYWNSVENAGGYNYKIGENGEVNTTRNRYVALSDIPVGEKLYVQAYADGCESTAWVMIYHNVVALATPVVTITGDTASWAAIENATGYVYKINDGEEQTTAETSVSGLNEGDTITVCATSTSSGFTNSEWSEVKRRPTTMPAPVLNTEYLEIDGSIEWTEIVGAEQYIVEVDGIEYTWLGNKYYNLEVGSTIRVRAVCNSGQYEPLGEWSEYFTRVDTREQLEKPTIAFDFETGLTVVAQEDVYYIYKFGQDGEEQYYYPEYTGEAELITQDIILPQGDYTIYVKAIPIDNQNYKESEWAIITIEF